MQATTSILITNAKVLTMDPDKPRAEAMLLKDGRVAAIGSRAEVEAQKTADTRVIDAGGKTVLPGFSENHLHLFSGAAELDHMQLTGVQGFDDLCQRPQQGRKAPLRPGLRLHDPRRGPTPDAPASRPHPARPSADPVRP